MWEKIFSASGEQRIRKETRQLEKERVRFEKRVRSAAEDLVEMMREVPWGARDRRALNGLKPPRFLSPEEAIGFMACVGRNAEIYHENTTGMPIRYDHKGSFEYTNANNQSRATGLKPYPEGLSFVFSRIIPSADSENPTDQIPQQES